MFFLSNKIVCNDSSIQTCSLMVILKALLSRQGRVVQEKSCEAGLPGLRWQVAADMDRQEPAQVVGEYSA